MSGGQGAQSGSSLPPWSVEFVCANGLSFETAMMGEGPDLALCLHGFPEHFVSWRFQAPMLARRGYRVWAPNLRGYGRSSRPSGRGAYRLQHLLDDVAGLYDAARAEGLRPSLLLAHDWGGLIAWAFVLNRLRPFDGLVAVNMPHPECARRGFWRRGQFLRSWYIALFQLPWLPEALFRAGRARAVERAFLSGASHPENFPEAALEIYRRSALAPGAMTAMLNYYRANLFALGRSDLLVGERCTDLPTLAIWGERDAYLGAHLLEGMEALVSDLAVRRLPDASHFAQQDAPAAVNAAIEAWLDRPEGLRPRAALP